MRSVFNYCALFGVVALSAQVSRVEAQSFDVSQGISPYQQLMTTRDCRGCNLSNLDLKGLDLSGANLENANLSNADLTNADLSQANLTGANFYLSNLSQSKLRQANLTRANLGSANVSNADLSQSVMDQVVANYADFSQADLSSSLIRDSNFADATFTGANFSVTSIQNTKFNNANLNQVDFSSASVTETSFSAADLDGTTLPSESSETVSRQPEDTNNAAESTSLEQSDSADPGSAQDRPASPLLKNNFPQPTANHLNRGDVVVGFSNRQFFKDATQDDGSTSANPGVHLDWGITDKTQLGVSFQVVDTGLPIRQGAFNTRRADNLDATLSLKQKVWENEEENLAVSAVASVAVGDRNAEFRGVGPTQIFSNNDVVPALQIPVTASLDSDRLDVTLSPTVAFFPNDHALFLTRPPIANPGSFGPTFGLSGAISYAVYPRLSLWGDAFVPLTGNNSLTVDTGLPAKAIAFNSGLRFLVNPRLGVDVFASNTLGQRAPLSLTAIRQNVAFGLGITLMPEIFASNRKYGDSFRSNDDGQDSPLTIDGLAFTDGGTVPKNRLALQVQGGQQGVLTALRYGVLRDFEAFGYLDYALGRFDESEQGFGLKLRLLDQASKDPVTVSAAVSVGLTNEVFTNFINNDPNAFANSGVAKKVPLVFQVDNPEGRRFLLSASLPIHYKVNDKFNTWLTPSVGYAQRLGVELAGLNVGASHEIAKDISLLAEVGANFIGRGNSFNNVGLVDRIPWTFAARWNPSALLGRNPDSLVQPHVEVYITNRVGSSTWNQLRVREGGDPAFGVGVQIPF